VKKLGVFETSIMPDPKEILQNRLTSLRLDYVSDVKKRIEFIKDSWAKARNCNCKSEEFYELTQQVHTLYSSSTTFGLTSLSDTAHKLDGLINSLNEIGDIPTQEHCAQIEIMIQALENITAKNMQSSSIRNNLLNPVKNIVIPDHDSKTIFVIDEDSLVSTQIAAMLESHGYIVNVFNDLLSLKNKIIKTKPALIIMEMMSAEGDLVGAKFLLDIKHRINTDLPTIFISEHDNIHARLQSVKAGSSHYLKKPLDVDKLLTAVDDLLIVHKLDPYRILIIDDDKPLSDFYALVLKQAGLSISVLNNPLETLDVINKIRPELILLDINMFECSGLELASVIRQQEKFTGVSIIFLSSDASLDRKLVAMDTGGDDFLSKPIDPNLLVTTVISRVDRARTLNNMATNLLATTRELENQHSALDKHAIVSITDVNGIISYVNDQFCEISGYSRDELIGNNHNILKSDYHVAAFYKGIWKTLNNKEIWQGEICNRNKRGEEYWVYTTIVPFVDDQLTPYQYVSVHNDITSQVLAQKTLMEDRDTAVNASQAKSDFLSRISHELRTPLNAILGFSQLIDSMNDNHAIETRKEYTNEILMAGDHLLKLINELLDLSRIEAGQLKIDMIAVPICTVLNECCSLMSPLAKKQQVKLIDNYHEWKDSLVSADPIRLKQVIVNLLSNAIKYNIEGGTVKINCKNNKADAILVEIINTGQSIPEDQFDKLFKPFSRLEMHQEKEGTGIGLVLSKSLVELMGATIGFENISNTETRFWIELAEENIEIEANETKLFISNTKSNHVTIQTKCTILYVEDNLINFKLVKEILSSRPNMKLLHAQTAEAGLEMIRSCHIDLILMDIQLPGMNGIECLHMIREETNQKDIPAIAVSAQTHLDENKFAIDSGFEDYISKPINVSGFLNTIDSIIKRTLN
jgi:PAS domain S-box-containing protein